MKPSSPEGHEGRSSFQLRFQSLFDARRAYAFPCDAVGHVDMDALGKRASNNYLYARAAIGREVSTPQVVAWPSAPRTGAWTVK
jgi:hypothetical protein